MTETAINNFCHLTNDNCKWFKQKCRLPANEKQKASVWTFCCTSFVSFNAIAKWFCSACNDFKLIEHLWICIKGKKTAKKLYTFWLNQERWRDERQTRRVMINNKNTFYWLVEDHTFECRNIIFYAYAQALNSRFCCCSTNAF